MNEDIETALREAAATLPSAAPLDLRRVAGEGLLDVAYATVDSPLGPLVVAATPRGLVRLAYTGSGGEGEVVEDLAGKLSPRILEAPERLDDVRRELDEYFDGRRADFDVPIDWSLTAPAARARCARPATRWGRTRSRSWCRATGCFAPAERWAATPAVWSARSSCCDWRACSPERAGYHRPSRRGGRVAEGTRLLSEYGEAISIAGSNPALSACGG